MRKIGHLRELFLEYPDATKALIIYADEHKHLDFSSLVKKIGSDQLGYDLLFNPFSDCMSNHDLLYEFFDHYNIWVSVCFNGTALYSVDDASSDDIRATFTYRISSPVSLIFGDSYFSRPKTEEAAFNTALMLLNQWLVNTQ